MAEYQTSNMCEVAAIACLTGLRPDDLVVVSSPRGRRFVIAKYHDLSKLPIPESLTITGMVEGREVSAPLLPNPNSDKEDYHNMLIRVKHEDFFQTLDKGETR